MRHEMTVAMPPQGQMGRVEQDEVTARSMLVITLRRLRRSHTAMLGLCIVVLLLLVAVFADALAPYSPTQTTATTMATPSWQHLMGTDLLGRDVFSRIIHGSRVSVYVGVVATVLGTFLGVPLGLLAGYYGGRLDNLIMRLMDVLLAFPIFLLAIVIMVILKPS